jgi:hypothetical protein
VAFGGDENFDPVAITAIGRCQKAISAAMYFLRSLQKLYLVGVQTAKNRRTSNQKLIARPIFHQPAALKPNTY